MPRKTKKQKILAAQHRQNAFVVKMPEAPVKNEPTPVKPSEQIIQSTEKSPVYSYFFSDLRKSLILTAIVVALEIALYYARLIK